jgi:hypothetical protein
VLFLRAHDPAPYRDALVQACVEDLAYDRQLEGNRANFLFDLIQATGDEVSFVETIVVALLTATEHWATDQLFALAVLFAKAGHAAARDAVHTRFDRHDAAEPFLGDEALVELDGLNGLLHVGDEVGQAVLSRPDTDADPHVLWFAQERFGVETVRQALTEAAANNGAIGAYLQSLDADRERQAQRRPVAHADLEAADYGELRAAIMHRAHGLSAP